MSTQDAKPTPSEVEAAKERLLRGHRATSDIDILLTDHDRLLGERERTWNEAIEAAAKHEPTLKTRGPATWYLCSCGFRDKGIDGDITWGDHIRAALTVPADRGELRKPSSELVAYHEALNAITTLFTFRHGFDYLTVKKAISILDTHPELGISMSSSDQTGRPSTAAPELRGAGVVDSRSIQDVLRLHIESSQNVREMYVRQGMTDRETFQDGYTNGLLRAIEVANERDRRGLVSGTATATPAPALREAAERARNEALEQAAGHLYIQSQIACSCGVEVSGPHGWADHVRSIPIRAAAPKSGTGD